MLDLHEIIPKITRILKEQNYVITDKIPSSFTLRPEIYTKKKDNPVAFYLRQSDYIPEALVQRISLIRRSKLKTECIIIFCKIPTKKTLFLLSTYGINAHSFVKNRLSSLLIIPHKQVLKKVVKKTKKRMPSTNIFISSHQVIDERNVAKEIIEDLSKAQRWPLFPICIEYDHRYNIKQTNQCEIDNMEDSDWFIGILAEEYRKEVNKEVKRALKDKFRTQNIIILVKSNKKTKDSWKYLISDIEKNTGIKHLPYVDIREFRSVLLGKIMHRVKEIHKKMRIPFMGEPLLNK